MKLKQLTRITTLILVLLLCMSVTLQTAGAYYDSGSCEETQEGTNPLVEHHEDFSVVTDPDGLVISYDKTMPIFDLKFEKGNEVVNTTAFYIQDTHGDGCTYLVTASATVHLIEEGYDATLAKEEYEEKAQYICTKGNFAFYYAPGLDLFSPLKVADSFTVYMIAFYQNVNSEKAYFLDYDVFGISSWVDYGSYYLSAGNTLNYTPYLGAPCMELNTDRIAGMLSVKGEGELAMISMLDLKFLPEAALFDADGNQLYEPQSIIEGISPITYVIVGAVVLALIFVMTRKSKSSAESAAPVDSGSFGHTVSLDRGGAQPISPVSPIKPIQPIATANYQVRAVGGRMDGKVSMLTASLRFGRSARCDVAFPQDAPGISGEHCEISVEGGRVVLRDLGSTYGTFLNKYTKLEARVPYTLQVGDTFTLADGGQTFLLEKIGAAAMGSAPAVRRVDNGESYQGDFSGQVTFGREMRNTVTFAADSGVSNNHCVLYKEDGQLYLKDLGSTNGTFFAEDKRLKPNHPYKVKKGVTFFLVSRRFSFTITEE